MSRENSKQSCSHGSKCTNEQCLCTEEETSAKFNPKKIGANESFDPLYCEEYSDYVIHKLTDAEQSILSKESFIKLLQNQLKLLKDRNIKSINDAQEYYYKYGVAAQELVDLKHICTKYEDELQKIRLERSHLYEYEQVASKYREEAEKWKKQYDALSTKVNVEGFSNKEHEEKPTFSTRTTSDEAKWRSIIQDEVSTAVNMLKENSQVVISSLEKQNKMLETMTDKLQTDLDVATTNEVQLQKELLAMKDKLFEAEAQSGIIKLELNHKYEENMNTLMTNNKRLQADLDTMAKLYTDLQKDYEENINKIETDFKRSHEIFDDYNIVKEEYRSLTRSLSGLSEEIVKAKENALAKNEELLQQVAALGPSTNMKQFISQITESLETIEMTCECKSDSGVSEQVTELSNSIADVEKINQLNSEIELKLLEVKTEKSINTLQVENKLLKDEMEHKYENLLSKLRESGEEIGFVSSELRSKNEMIQNQNHQISNLNKIVQNEQFRNELLESEIVNVKGNIQKEKTSYVELSVENKELKSQLDNAVYEKKSLEEENISIKSSLDEIEKINEDLNKQLKENILLLLNEMTRKMDDSQNRMKEFEKSNQDLKEVIDNLKAVTVEEKTKEWEDKINKLLEENDNLKLQLEKERNSLIFWKKHVESLQCYHDNEVKANNTRLKEFEVESNVMKRSFQKDIEKLTNVNKLLEMICQKEKKDVRDINSTVEKQYRWKGTFTGYSKLIDLLQYVLEQPCSPGIVLCITEKIYGRAHVLCNGEQYLDSTQTSIIKRNFGYQDSVVKEFLKKAIKLGYKDTVSVMLSGDIYHCIRLMKWEVFKEKQEFLAAYDMIKETVADVISSWVEDKQSCKDYVQNLLDQGIEMSMKNVDKDNLILQLEYLGKKVMNKNSLTKENLMKELKELGKEKGEVRLKPTVVGALISTLFFKHQDEAMKVVKGKLFALKTTMSEKSIKEKKLNELNQKVNSGEPIDGTVLGLIESLNSGNHLSSNWFFREVLVKVVNGNLDKLKAVCTAICKEPMEELLKGEEVHENVIDVLQFFCVEKDFLLEKSIPGNSDDALVRNSQSVEENVSNRSEKSISSSSRQSSADHDPQSSTVPISQGEKSIPSAASKKSCSASNLPSSIVAEKNNEGVMQNNCGQGGNPCYSINTGRDSYYPNIRNDFMGVRMKKVEQEGVLSKIRSKQRDLLRKKLSGDPLPKICYLEQAHRERYRKAFLNKMVNSKFPDPSVLLGIDCSSLSDLSNSTLGDLSDLDKSYEDDTYLAGMQNYTQGLDLLAVGDKNLAKSKIRDSAKKGFECGMYAYAIMQLQEVIEGNVTGSMLGVKQTPECAFKEAVECMIGSGRAFFPLNSFMLGIMQLYDVGGYGSIAREMSKKSWEIHFADVLRATKNTPFMSQIKDYGLLDLVGETSSDFTEPSDYLELVGRDKGIQQLEEMVRYIKYELARSMVSDEKKSHNAERLFEQLSSSGFADAQFSHAAMLFTGKFDQGEVDKVRKRIHSLLKSASYQLPEARVFLGVLLFKDGYGFIKPNNYWSYLEDYLNMSCGDDDLEQKNLKEKVAIFVSREYINKGSYYVRPDEQKARGILRQHCKEKDQYEKLEKAIKKGQSYSENLLNDVLRTLDHVHFIFQQKSDTSTRTKLLFSKIKKLHEKLENGKIFIQNSQRLSSVLQQLNNISFPKEEDLVLLQPLYYILEVEVNNHPSASSKTEILLILQDLCKLNVIVQERRS